MKEITVNNIAYECSYCDYRFTVKKDCQKHELLTHKTKNKYIEGTYIFWIETNEQAKEIAELVLGYNAVHRIEKAGWYYFMDERTDYWGFSLVDKEFYLLHYLRIEKQHLEEKTKEIENMIAENNN